MSLIQFNPQPGESILFRSTPNRKWYDVVWKIVSNLLGIGFLLILIYFLIAEPTKGALLSFLPVWAATLLTKTLYLGLLPLIGAVWIAEDVACVFIGEFILTNKQIWVRGSPFSWSQSATPLENIASLSCRRDAIFIKQTSPKKTHVHILSDAKLFLKAYEQFSGKSSKL